MAERLSDKEWARTLKALARHNGHQRSAAKDLGIGRPAIASRILNARARGLEVPVYERIAGGPRLSAGKVAEAVAALEAHGGHKTNAARSLGLHRNSFASRLSTAELRDDWIPQGRARALTPVKMPLPTGNKVARYVLTCAQSGTKLHEPTWTALNALARHYGAKTLVSTFSYAHRQEGSAKRGTQGGDRGVDWYDPRIEPHVSDDMVALAPSLIWNGHMNILPTAVDPLSGMSNYNGRASSIFPHVKVAMVSVPTMAGSAAKLQYTTGTATQLNYIAKKAGQKAEFDHVFGGLIVEVNSDGAWWVRQLHVDSKGRLYDLDLCVMPDGVVAPGIGASVVVFGDLHDAQLADTTRAEKWGSKGMVAALRPAVQIAHDILDFQSRSHHARKDPHAMFELHARGKENIQDEVKGVGALLKLMAQHSKVIVVNSNHDRHLERWLKEADWRTDPVNAEFYVACQAAFLGAIRAGKRFDALKWAVDKYNAAKGVRFLDPGESFIVCRDGSGGVELGLHGDLGPGGSRGSIRNLSRIGRKVVIGHSHSAGIHNGAYQVGVSARLDMEYARAAPGAWSHTDCVVYPNGKRALLTWWRGKWRA